MVFELQGHRGARGLKPDNTLPSFEAALDAGVTSIETDLHLTKDGVPVLVHDPTVSGRAIAAMTSAEACRIRVDQNSNPKRFPDQTATLTPVASRFAQERGLDPFGIPTLDSLFAFAAAYAGDLGKQAGKSAAQRAAAASVWFDLELKRVPFRPEYIGGGIEEKVWAAIQAAGTVKHTRIRSFDHGCLLPFRHWDLSLETAVIISDTAPIAPVHLVRAAGASLYCPDFEFLDEAMIRDLHAAKVRVIPWTVNDAADWGRLIDMGADGITTDYPDRLAAYLDSRAIPFRNKQ
jgi:glycerophosphoryl diester phosphodiesterase